MLVIIFFNFKILFVDFIDMAHKDSLMCALQPPLTEAKACWIRWRPKRSKLVSYLLRRVGDIHFFDALKISLHSGVSNVT